MDPDRQNRTSDLYHRALARPPEQRPAFLLNACGEDEALREEVESLLRYERSAASFLETPAAQVNGAAPHSMLNRQFGPYTIVAPLGAGGMGEVYRAHDSSLDRDVAIKFLPPHVTADPERRARFAREARLLASLNHPNIGTIYGLEEVDGASALVLELIDGPTLADRLARGPLTLRVALALARDVADALEAAHQKGIIHRDLKPSNIVLQGWSAESRAPSAHARARVVDFGLAKPIMSAAGDAESRPQADSVGDTAQGRILGTPAYMSPEQARGEATDKRTDIWAFGCVLFEMLTAQQPFGGRTATDTLARVLERDPDWAALPATTPEIIRRLLRRCLEKEPARRLRDIGDARLEIDEMLIALSSDNRAGPAHRPAGFRRRAWLAAASGAMLIMLALGVDTCTPSPEGPTASGLEVTRLTFDEGLQTDPTLAPDGQFIAYSSNRLGNFDIYAQPVRGGNPVPVTTHPGHDWQPHWSVKDQLVFRSERDGGGLYVVAPTGGHEQRIASFGYQPQWSPDGLQILLSSSSFSTSLYIASPDGAPPRSCELCSDEVLEERAPHGSGAFGWFGDARHVSTLLSEAAPQHRPHLRIVDLESGSADEWSIGPRVVDAFQDLRISIPSRPLAWSPDARAIYFVGVSREISAIWKLDIDPEERLVTGGPHRMTTMAEGASGVAIARATGSVAFAAASGQARTWWYPLDDSGRRIIGQPSVVTPPEAQAVDPDVTADGGLVVFTLRRPGGAGGTELRAQTRHDGRDRILRISDSLRGEVRGQPHPSPDGRYVVYRYVAPESEGPGRGGGAYGPQDLRWLDLTTSEETKLTQTTSGTILPGGWSPDGRFVVARVERRRVERGGAGMLIALLPLSAAPAAEAQMKVVTASSDGLAQPSMSPDGRWIAFVSNRKGVGRIAVVGSADGLWNEPVDERHWRYIDEDLSRKDKPRWSADGRVLYFVSSRGGLLNVWAVDVDPDTGAFSTPFRITEFDGPGGQIPSNMYALEIGAARGGLAIPTVHPTGAIWLLHPPW